MVGTAPLGNDVEHCHGMVSMSEWTTRLAPEITSQFGVEELHGVCFVPRGWPGKGPAVSLGIPECELSIVWSPGVGPW